MRSPPTQPTELREAGSSISPQTHRRGAWDWTSRFLWVFFFPLYLLQTAAISDLVVAHSFSKEQQTVWQIILQIPLSTTGLQGWFLNIICSLQGVLLTRSQEQSCRVGCGLTDSIDSLHISTEFIFEHITATNAFYVHWSSDSGSVTSTPSGKKNSRSSLSRI